MTRRATVAAVTVASPGREELRAMGYLRPRTDEESSTTTNEGPPGSVSAPSMAWDDTYMEQRATTDDDNV